MVFLKQTPSPGGPPTQHVDELRDRKENKWEGASRLFLEKGAEYETYIAMHAMYYHEMDVWGEVEGEVGAVIERI